MFYLLLPIIISMVLMGCAGGNLKAAEPVTNFHSDERPLAKTMVYDCNGYDFIARLGPGEMAVWLPDRYVILSQVRSASGTKYVEGDIEFWSKGDEAMVTVGDQQHFNCTLVPWRVPWEDARRRGVEFRAVGNEPGWSLEIQGEKHLLFLGDYGMQRVALPNPGVQTQGNVRRYHAITESVELQLEIVQQSCFDSMSGEPFPNQVTVTLDGDIFYGCGRDLDYPWE
jgi:uncharacterized membrane protein/membrane-bound inhibitor of C-type lysozyme